MTDATENNMTENNRTLHIHKISPASKELEITVMDFPGAGGANHYYRISGMNYANNPGTSAEFGEANTVTDIHFQNGAMQEPNAYTGEPNGVNGITEQALLAIIIDRYESFQAGPFACEQNAGALLNMKQALMWMNARTIDRMTRGVEGTNAK